MKVKTDFVTNSSSTSFIVNDKTTNSVAKKMLDVIFKERKDYWEKYYDEDEKIFEDEMYKTVKELKVDENIMIPFSTNYESFIFKSKKGIIYVETCYNHQWENKLRIENYIVDDEIYFDLHEEMSKEVFVNIKSGKVALPETLLYNEYSGEN